MSRLTEEIKSRRDLLRAIGRAISLGCLAIIGGVVMLRKSNSQQGQACRNLDLCQGCKVFERCALPQRLTLGKNDKE